LPKQIDAVKNELRREIGIDSRDKWDPSVGQTSHYKLAEFVGIKPSRTVDGKTYAEIVKHSDGTMMSVSEAIMSLRSRLDQIDIEHVDDEVVDITREFSQLRSFVDPNNAIWKQGGMFAGMTASQGLLSFVNATNQSFSDTQQSIQAVQNDLNGFKTDTANSLTAISGDITNL
jgi:hypothetical protein